MRYIKQQEKVHMKIALYNLTTTIKKGGIESFCWGLGENLSKKGIEIDLYSGKTDNILPFQENLKIITLPYVLRNKFPDFGSRFRKFMERLTFAYYALPELKKNKYDFFCIFKPYDLPVALYFKKLTNCKIIFFSGGTEFFPGYRTMIKKVDFLFSCSEFNAKQIEDYSGIKPRILPNGIDTELFRSCQQDLKLRNELKISDDFIIITVCRLIGLKGIQYGIKAVKILIEEGFKIKYLIIGDGEYKKNLEELVKALHIEDNVIFLGSKENSQLPKYYSLSHVAIFPSLADETFGISIAEAMSCGIPVISTNIGGIPEVIGKNGFLVSPCNDREIAIKLKLLINDESLRREMALEGRKRIIEKFSWEIIIDKFIKELGITSNEN